MQVTTPLKKDDGGGGARVDNDDQGEGGEENVWLPYVCVCVWFCTIFEMYNFSGLHGAITSP